MVAQTFDYKKFNELRKTPKYWGNLDPENRTHRYIMSLMHQLEWVVYKPEYERNLPDSERLGKWLQSEKAPVRKPIKKMDKQDLSKIIVALESMLTKKYPGNGK